jgi:hypothetical protein
MRLSNGIVVQYLDRARRASFWEYSMDYDSLKIRYEVGQQLGMITRMYGVGVG